MTTLLEAAEDARRRGRIRKAIKRYRKVLALHPDDPSVHARLAPLLARRGKLREAADSFVVAAAAEAQRGFADRAIGLYQSAARVAPREAPLWRAIAELHVQRGRSADAIATLIEGARAVRRDRAAVAELLRRALELDPYHVQVTIALAKVAPRAEGRALLEAMAGHAQGAALRAVRRALFLLSPTPASLWRWLRA